MQHSSVLKYMCTIFLSLWFFPTRFFPSKVLTEHIIYGHPRGSVIKYYSVDVHYTNKLLTIIYTIFLIMKIIITSITFTFIIIILLTFHFHKLPIIFMLMSCLWLTFYMPLCYTINRGLRVHIVYTWRFDKYFD